MSTVTVKGMVEMVVERDKWILVYIKNQLTPIAFPADADYIPREGEIVEGKARRGRNWLFALPGWKVVGVKAKVEAGREEYVEVPVNKLVLHPIHLELGRGADEELIENVKANGVLEPLIVRRVGEGYFEVLSGSRRLDAAKKAGLQSVPCRIVEADDRKASLIAVWENIHRKNLNPIEEAKCYKFLKENFNLTFSDIAKMTNKSRRHIIRIVNLLKLPDKVKKQIESDILSPSTAVLLIEKLGEENKEVIEKLAEKVIEEKITYNQLEDYVNKHLCSNCKAWIEPEETKFIDGMHLCPKCYEDYQSFLKAQEEKQEKEKTLVLPPPAITIKEEEEKQEEKQVKSQEELRMQFIQEHLSKVREALEKAISALKKAETSFEVLNNEYVECEECIANNLCMDFLNQLLNLKTCIIERLLYEWIGIEAEQVGKGQVKP
ncbi:MAG: hypothetical protein DRJ60_00110 [Thermoprotei archaeon]|nr:MAG: hypothetical protein DRJ60_00110 [Thermoprotei archaeon]